MNTCGGYKRMREAGYRPDTSEALHGLDEEGKVEHLCWHSEKLAIAFGLLTSAPSEPITVLKNLRVCGDCHAASKALSRLTKRTIIVRDASRWHEFVDGRCSCNDYF